MEQFQRGGGGGRRTRTRHRHRLRRRPRHGTLRQLLGQMFRDAERRTSLGSFAGSRGSALIGHRSQQERPAVCTPPHFTGFRHPPERRDLLLTGRQQRLHAQYLSGSRPQPERPGRSDDPQTFRPRHADRRRETFGSTAMPRSTTAANTATTGRSRAWSLYPERTKQTAMPAIPSS